MLLRVVVLLFIISAYACAPVAGHVPAHDAAPGRGKGGGVFDKKEKQPGDVAASIAIDMSGLETLADIIKGVSSKKIIYVGEYHDRYSHHGVQLEVIKRLYAEDHKIAVGMEMFQRPFQDALDDYISGAITERRFLKSSEYFKRWGFDYNLYKPILDFCRERRIPVVALNVAREITEKISKSGLDSLTEQEKREIPSELDLSDEEYRQRLKEVFADHAGSDDKSFDYFYQAQVVWDETMALSIDEFMKKNPGYRMVVIAGIGHVAHGSGIPRRAYRRNMLDYAIILIDGEVEKGIADYIVFPEKKEGAASLRLMAGLKEVEGRVVIRGLEKKSPARQAGLKEGDRILSINGESINDIQDVKIALFYLRKGEPFSVTIMRRRLFFWEKQMTLQVML